MSAATTPIRVGLLLPSTNVTLETALPAVLARHQAVRFTFHSSRMRLQGGAEESLQALPLLTRHRAARLTCYGSRVQMPPGAEAALQLQRLQGRRTPGHRVPGGARWVPGHAVGTRTRQDSLPKSRHAQER